MTDRNSCAACAHLAAFSPATCGRFHDPLTHRPRLAQPLRQPDGPCGPNGSAFEPAPAPTAVVLDLPIPHRVSA
ncbi:transmembrane and ubiquitin-like domain containing 1 [Hyphomicrobium denitrificans ATCC 51888]|uniref:Transmembrane and ubiquitin-like domain containing 1 n=1 Tax=Hyphomicrobium denitrificans (strain ATCC 51888 / DSM 1869 / NCIMB 11706 / TK 0415) TaxID=582899 RepID=D8JVF8_HYPDA|nr:hypothetical protein [Hyphomicrobium denitrificans]ADJ24812.1 transmembrane and ubiquitin-like domain containing 1 [Hyphomicrobium denitrificans ATCC 51888]